MRSIAKPSDDPKDVYLTCINRVEDPGLKNRLESIADNVRDAAVEYDRNATDGSLYRLDEHDNVAGVVTKKEMEKVYTSRMAKKGTPGRPIYDKLKASAPYGICPLCGQRTVSTLDHYLPKANFPTMVVLPYNLIPACSDCNKAKLDEVPQTAETQTLHPYYDNVTNEQWLYAEVIQTTPASMRFFVNAPAVWDDILKARAQHHFVIFDLGYLYASQAASMLADIRGQLISLFNRGGEVAVREHLNEAASSRRENHINSWQTAMYQALANSDWFCSGGFQNV